MDIWWVMQTTAAATLVGAVIWGLKLLFHDKLDARWHYLIWLVLLVRILVPVQIDFIRTPVSLFEAFPVLHWIDLWELTASKAGGRPWPAVLWKVYAAGAVFLLLFYLASYLALRIRIAAAGARKSGAMRPASAAVCRQVEEIARRYGLKSCRVIRVEKSASTPYVCGLWRTALVLSQDLAERLEKREREAEGEVVCAAEEEKCGSASFRPEEAMILHELLHRKYRDVLVNFVLHLVRALNWFNPFIWYLTSMVQNDSEALCDQRVLEYMERESEDGDSCEREYGMLLIDMALGRKKKPVRIGTSNMANSFRNMKTRIRRIADFKKVPSGIGVVTLCITLILSASGIGYCQEEGLESTNIRSERDLRRALLEAQLYEAKSPAEALWLYLAAVQNGNPVYLMAVLPEDMRADYEAWVMEHYSGGAFFDHNVWVEEWEESVYFPQRPFWLTNFRIFNLRTAEPGRAQAGVLVSYKRDELLWWELEFYEEDGWKAVRKSDGPVDAAAFEEPKLCRLTGEGQSFRVEMDCWNEGYFSGFNQLSPEGFQPMQSWENAAGAGKEGRFLEELSMEYKMWADYLIYTGEEDLTDRTVGVVILEERTDRSGWEEYFLAMERGAGTGSSGDGNLFCNVSGERLTETDRVQVGGGGSGPDRWDGTEICSYHVWVYVDQECAEEFDISLP